MSVCLSDITVYHDVQMHHLVFANSCTILIFFYQQMQKSVVYRCDQHTRQT
jgi:hypothetical protein